MNPRTERQDTERAQTLALKKRMKKPTYSSKPTETSSSETLVPTEQELRSIDLRSEHGGACGNVTRAPGAPALVEQTVLDQPGIKLLAGYL
jgi:hypothetical protein